MENKDVFLLEHVYLLPDKGESIKTIGIYSSKEAAELAVERLGCQPGFKDCLNGFVIDKYSLDEDNWVEGFVTFRGKC